MSEQYSKKQTELSALEDENKITPNGLAEFMEDNDTLFVKLLKKTKCYDATSDRQTLTPIVSQLIAGSSFYREE